MNGNGNGKENKGVCVHVDDDVFVGNTSKTMSRLG